MSKVNQEIQEMGDSTLYIVQLFIDIWNAIFEFWITVPIEMKMYLAVMYVSSAVMQYYKKTKLKDYVYKTDRRDALNKASMPLSILTAAGAGAIYWGTMHYGWFIFAGLTATKSAMYVHFVVIDFLPEKIKSLFKLRLTKVD